MMTSPALIFLLTLGIIASAMFPADARSKGPVKPKKSTARRELENSLESELRSSSDTESPPRLLSESRVPISKSLARKLSEMLAIAVAEAVAQVVEDEPSKLTACTALLRRRNYNSNVNQNVNYNTNTNANFNGLKKQIPLPAQETPPDEEEQMDDESSEEEVESNEEGESEEEEDEKSESGEEPSLEEDRRDIKLPKDLLSKLKPKSFARRPRQPIRTKNRTKNVNVNTNANTSNNIISLRKGDSNRNEVITSGETDEATTEMPKQEIKENARRRMRHN